MMYVTARQFIKTGDIVFFNSSSVTASAIRLVTKGRWNHVGIAVRLIVFGVSRVFILEETPEGRRLCNMSIRASQVEVYRVPLLDTDILAEYLENTGSPYSVWNAVIAGLNLPRWMKQSKANICSQMVADFLYDQGYWVDGDTLLHPNKLEKICSKILGRIA